MEVESLTSVFADLNIDANTSRHAATKNKPQDLHRCLLCLYRFHNANLFKKHLKDVHRAQSQQITQEYKDAKKSRDENPDDEIYQENFRIALAKVTLLEKF
jgi:hypothetical protein